MPVTINGTTGIAGVDGSAGTPSYQGTDTNTGLFYPAANTVSIGTGGSERLRIDSSGNVLIGTTTARVFDSSTSTITPSLQNEGTDANGSSASLMRNTATNAGPVLFLGKSRSGALGGVTIVQSGDQMGQIIFEGTDGTGLIEGASIRAEVDGTPGTNDMPGRLVFTTTADGSSSPTERMRIDSSGNVGINSTNPTQYDTSGGRILNIRGTASNSSPATIFMNGNSSVPGAGYYTQEVFSIGVTASQEISRVTGTGANGFRSMIRISLCGHTGAKGNGHIYAMYYWDGGTAAPVQIFRYDSGTNIPGLSFNTSTSNVLITNLSSSDGSNLFQGVMTIEYFLPIDFASSTYTIS